MDEPSTDRPPSKQSHEAEHTEPLSPEEAVRIVLGIPRKTTHVPEEKRFAVCDVCGQIFDLQDDAQLSHHGSGEHQALILDS